MSARRWSAIFLLVALPIGLSGCGPDQTLEQAINCDQFARAPDATWSTKDDVSLDYRQDGVRYQVNLSKGVRLDGKRQGEASVVPALEKKCAAKP